MDPDGLLPIGKTVGVHGINGIIKVHYYIEPTIISRHAGPILFRYEKGGGKSYKIRWAKPHKRIFLVSLKGIENRNQAEFLIGSILLMEKRRLPELGEDSYYWADIIGLKVVTDNKGYLGIITDIIPTGANDVYVVKLEDDEILIPGLASVVLGIDIKTKTMRVALPEGLSE